jgi:hypothetical protein
MYRASGPEFGAPQPQPQRPAEQPGGGLPALPAPAPGEGSAEVLSLSQRFAAMRASVGQRLACGKSAIHGWGAFAKVAHAAGARRGCGAGAGAGGAAVMLVL